MSGLHFPSGTNKGACMLVIYNVTFLLGTRDWDQLSAMEEATHTWHDWADVKITKMNVLYISVIDDEGQWYEIYKW